MIPTRRVEVDEVAFVRRRRFERLLPPVEPGGAHWRPAMYQHDALTAFYGSASALTHAGEYFDLPAVIDWSSIVGAGSKVATDTFHLIAPNAALLGGHIYPEGQIAPLRSINTLQQAYAIVTLPYLDVTGTVITAPPPPEPATNPPRSRHFSDYTGVQYALHGHDRTVFLNLRTNNEGLHFRVTHIQGLSVTFGDVTLDDDTFGYLRSFYAGQYEGANAGLMGGYVTLAHGTLRANGSVDMLIEYSGVWSTHDGTTESRRIERSLQRVTLSTSGAACLKIREQHATGTKNTNGEWEYPEWVGLAHPSMDETTPFPQSATRLFSAAAYGAMMFEGEYGVTYGHTDQFGFLPDGVRMFNVDYATGKVHDGEAGVLTKWIDNGRLVRAFLGDPLTARNKGSIWQETDHPSITPDATLTVASVERDGNVTRVRVEEDLRTARGYMYGMHDGNALNVFGLDPIDRVLFSYHAAWHAGIKPGDVIDVPGLNGMGNVTLGAIPVYHAPRYHTFNREEVYADSITTQGGTLTGSVTDTHQRLTTRSRDLKLSGVTWTVQGSGVLTVTFPPLTLAPGENLIRAFGSVILRAGIPAGATVTLEAGGVVIAALTGGSWRQFNPVPARWDWTLRRPASVPLAWLVRVVAAADARTHIRVAQASLLVGHLAPE